MYWFQYVGDFDDPSVQAWKDLHQYMANHEVPPVELREKLKPVDGARADHKTTMDCPYFYDEIDEKIINNSHSPYAWYGPTPAPVHNVMQVITECWLKVKKLGYYPSNKKPTDMTDEQVMAVIDELNLALYDEWYPWGRVAGYSDYPRFEDLDIGSYRAIVAEIQEEIHRSEVKKYLRKEI